MALDAGIPSDRPARWKRRVLALLAAGAVAGAAGLGWWMHERSAAQQEIGAAGFPPATAGLIEALVKGRTDLLPAYERLGLRVSGTPRTIEAAVMSGSSSVLSAVLQKGARAANEPHPERLLPAALRSTDPALLDAVLKLRPLQPEAVPDLFASLRHRPNWALFPRLAREPLLRTHRDAEGYALPHLAAMAPTPEAWNALGGTPPLDLKAATGAGDSALHFAARAGHAEVVRAVLRSGLDPTQHNDRGHMPIDVAFSLQHDAALAAMAGNEAGARLLATYLVALAQKGLRATVLALAGHGVPLDGPAARGLTLLALAVHADDAALLTALLERGARPDTPSTVSGVTGVTPLMLAAARGKKELVRLLLARGADPSLTASSGATAAALAARNGHHAVAEMLQH